MSKPKLNPFALRAMLKNRGADVNLLRQYVRWMLPYATAYGGGLSPEEMSKHNEIIKEIKAVLRVTK